MSDTVVSPARWAALEARLRRLGIREDDLDEQFVRSGGPGGQHVNKVATCVVLTHRPSGLTVRCREARSQGINRYLARERLADKIEERRGLEAAQQRQEIEKLRRQKRKRSKAAKDRMLAAKRHRSEIKAQRRPPRAES